jgi:hypothetical protein
MKIIGRFYFKQTSNGNLIGEFSNNGSEPSTESCDLISSANSNYLGEYDSSWQEDGKPFYAKLKIWKKEGKMRIFSLEWKRNDKPIFTGEGMLCNDVLIGNYQSAE